MSISFEQLNDTSCKTYLVKEIDSNEVYIIDPVLEQVNDYLDHLKKNNYTLKMIIDTHTHADHISGAAALKDHTDCEYVMHENAPSQCVTKRVKEGDKIEVASVQVSILESHGHTRDSISLIFPDRIFTGDALFLDEGGAGP